MLQLASKFGADEICRSMTRSQREILDLQTSPVKDIIGTPRMLLERNVGNRYLGR